MNQTLELENELEIFMTTAKALELEASDIYKQYFATDASSTVSALLLNSTPATVSSKLTKAAVVSGITFVEQLNNFFANSAVSQADYHDTLQDLLYGNASLGSILTVSVESVGTRLQSLAGTCLTLFKKAKTLLDYYSDTEISAAVGAISTTTVVFGATKTKSVYTSGITLVEQFKKMINNEAVTTGDYGATLSKWISV